jgi:tripartite-type tricarboxylate transporter receptor subunit TctC
MKRKDYFSGIMMILICVFVFYGWTQTVKVWGQANYPSKPVQILTGMPAGGQGDMMNRVLAEFLKKKFGQPFVVVNMTGGGGSMAANAVAKAEPDGYTVGPMGETQYMGRFVTKGHPIQLSNYKPIANFYLNENVVVVHPDSGWKTMNELIQYAKGNPGLKFANIGMGSSTWWRAMFLCKEAGIRLEGVPFEGDPGILSAVLGKHVPIGIMSYVNTKPMQTAGRLRILMTLGPEKIEGEPNLPTLAEILGRDVKIYQNIAPLFAPSRTPDPIVRTLSEAVKEISSDQAFKSKMDEMKVRIRYMDEREISNQLRYMEGLFQQILESIKQ